jgi:hypothetical protein
VRKSQGCPNSYVVVVYLLGNVPCPLMSRYEWSKSQVGCRMLVVPKALSNFLLENLKDEDALPQPALEILGKDPS